MAELTRLTFEVTSENADLLSGLLALHVPYGWEEATKADGTTLCFVHSGHEGFCVELASTVKNFLPSVQVTLETIEEVNWLEAWKEFFTPVDGGKHFLVLAPWMKKEREATKKTPLIIEPKMAFGTGHHPSTALCLQAISELFTEGRIQPHMQFFDLGTGSGILGIACAKLGLVGEGADIDAPSVENALENREINGIAQSAFEVKLGGVEHLSGAYHFFVANILAEPLCFMAPQIVARIATRATFGLLPPLPNNREMGCLVLSGILERQADAVEAVYVNLGMPKARRLIQNDWAALVFTG